jgi:type IV pilus assembly protein PilE
MKLQKGFTLIELLVVVAIIGILATVALPAYSNYVIRAKIPDATSNLASKRVAMEQFFQDNHTYLGANAAAGLPCFKDTTTSQYYTFSCLNLTASTYTIQALGTGTMTEFTYSIDQNNTKTTIAVPTAAGWTLPTSNCWATSQAGTC